jgi:hypothetical protein
MKEELKNLNIDEKLNTLTPSEFTSLTSGRALSIAGNAKRSGIDFDFLAGDQDETNDNSNYYALLRFTFS